MRSQIPNPNRGKPRLASCHVIATAAAPARFVAQSLATVHSPRIFNTSGHCHNWDSQAKRGYTIWHFHPR